MNTVARLVGCLALCALAACAQLKPRPELPLESAVPPGSDGALDLAFAGLEAQRPNASAFRLLIAGTEAFVTRIQSARRASRSIDVQTYIWHADLTGMYVASTLIEAADRGVQVRVLIDDMDARAKNAGFAALAAHPNISVRLFNPFASRHGPLRKMSEGLTSFKRLNHRMHNKTWIVDNRLAIAGGRNIGDEYFGASERVNFVDLEFATIGPVVRDASASFDKYWNSAAVYPVQTLDPESVTPAALAKLRERLATRVREAEASGYAAALKSDDAVKSLVAGDRPLEWTSVYRFISDDPLKATMSKSDPHRAEVGSALIDKIKTAQTSLTIMSPYFVPGEEGTKILVAAAQSTRSVRILTNSLSSNDVSAVHGGYSQYRKRLLQGGVQLWELKPITGEAAKSSLFGSSDSSLHTKALAVDASTLFVGSYNLDPRSTWLNCEQGILVQDALLSGQFETIFAKQTDGAHAWKVSLVKDDLHWTDGVENFTSDPKASWWRHFKAWLTHALGFEAQL